MAVVATRRMSYIAYAARDAIMMQSTEGRHDAVQPAREMQPLRERAAAMCGLLARGRDAPEWMQ